MRYILPGFGDYDHNLALYTSWTPDIEKETATKRQRIVWKEIERENKHKPKQKPQNVQLNGFVVGECCVENLLYCNAIELILFKSLHVNRC